MSDSFSLSQEIIAPDTFNDVVQELGTGANELLAAVQKDETVFYDELVEYNEDQKNFLNWNIEQQYDPSPMFHVPQPSPPQIPANVDYAGELDFNILISPQTASRNSWIYSEPLQKVYINMQNVLPIDVKRNVTNKRLYLRARMLFSLPQYAQEMVARCSAHIDPKASINKDVDSVMIKHVLWCTNANSVYQGNTELNEHLSVVTPLGEPQAGMDTVRVNYKFMCKNSCPSGMNRRPVDVIFTLEDGLGNVLGRRKIAVRVCSCPKRDKEKEEKEYKDTNQSAPSNTRKRRYIPAARPDDETNMNASSDDTVIEIPSFPVVGRRAAELILQTARNTMHFEIHAAHVDEAKRIKIKKCLDEINNVYKNLPPIPNDGSYSCTCFD